MKTVRVCIECAADLTDAFNVIKCGLLNIDSGICAVCGKRRPLEAYKIVSKRKERGNEDEDS